VLFPGGPLPLRIFETRYVDMVRHCMREHCPFGVLLIRAGSEVGAAGAGETSAIGTTARIVDFNALPDGLLGITCIGERKFSVSKQWQREDGLHVGDIEFAAPEEPTELPTSENCCAKYCPSWVSFMPRYLNASRMPHGWAAGWRKSCQLRCPRSNTAWSSTIPSRGWPA
jgi:hypothetical protein